MKYEEFAAIVDQIVIRFPQAFPKDPAQSVKSTKAWFADLQEFDAQRIFSAARLFWQTTEQLYPGANIGAILRNRASATVTSATIENHLARACAMALDPKGDQYAYLKNIDPRLLELAEQAALFDRGLSTEAQGFRVRDVSKRYLEEKENERKGFARAPAPLYRRLDAPSKKPEWNEQAALNKRNIDEIAKKLGEKKAA